MKSGVGHVDIDAVAMRTRVHSILVEKPFQHFDQRIMDCLAMPACGEVEAQDPVSGNSPGCLVVDSE